MFVRSAGGAANSRVMKKNSGFRLIRAARRGVLAALAVFLSQPDARAQLAIERFEVRADGRFTLDFPSDPSSYYRLLLGPRVDAVNQVGALSLTRPLITPLSGGESAFFRIQQVSRAASLDTDADGIPDVYELQHPPLDGLNPADARLDLDGNGRTELEDYLDATTPPRPVRIAGTSPFPGEAGVSVNREVVVFFSEPLAADAVVNAANFHAGFGGRRFLSRVELSSDRRKATLFFLEPIPGSTRVTVVFDAAAVRGANGLLVDADGDGVPGGVNRLQYDTYSTTGVAGAADDCALGDLGLDLPEQISSLAVTTAQPLPPGSYRLRLAPPLADLAGNPLAAPFTLDLIVYDGALDTDGDGLPDDVERLLGTDPTRPDTNGNGVPDGLEDPDGDGLGSAFEILARLDPRRRDTDGNGINDGQEDLDNDALTNLVEFQNGLNPRHPETDGDGWLDEAEVTAGSDGRDPRAVPSLPGYARPATQLILPQAPQLDLANLGLVLARPQLSLVLPVAPQLAPEEAGLTVARPVTFLTLPVAPHLEAGELGLSVARPAVQLMLPRTSPDDDVEPGTTVARPVVTLRLDR